MKQIDDYQTEAFKQVVQQPSKSNKPNTKQSPRLIQRADND